MVVREDDRIIKVSEGSVKYSVLVKTCTLYRRCSRWHVLVFLGFYCQDVWIKQCD